MNVKTSNDTPSVRRMKAAEWLVKLQNPDLTTDEIFEWENWLEQSELNRHAFDDAEKLARRILVIKDDLGDIPIPSQDDIENDDYDGSVSIAEFTRRETPTVHHPIHSGRFSRAIWSRPLAMAAGFAAIAVLTVFLLRGNLIEPNGLDQIESYQTSLSEHRNVVLSDGSEVVLGAVSSISVNFTSGQRMVVLDRGEALFTVSKDSNRPFVVVAGLGSITAVGTAFNVRRDEGRVVVTVTEGTVKFNPTQKNPAASSTGNPGIISTPEPQQLTVGYQAVYGAGSLEVVKLQDPTIVTSWQSGRLQYLAEPLKYVITGVNRYSDIEIIIADKSIGEMVFTGSVFQDQTDSWLLGLEEVFSIEVVATGNDKVLLKKRTHL